MPPKSVAPNVSELRLPAPAALDDMSENLYQIVLTAAGGSRVDAVRFARTSVREVVTKHRLQPIAVLVLAQPSAQGLVAQRGCLMFFAGPPAYTTKALEYRTGAIVSQSEYTNIEREQALPVMRTLSKIIAPIMPDSNKGVMMFSDSFVDATMEAVLVSATDFSITENISYEFSLDKSQGCLFLIRNTKGHRNTIAAERIMPPPLLNLSKKPEPDELMGGQLEKNQWH